MILKESPKGYRQRSVEHVKNKMNSLLYAAILITTNALVLVLLFLIFMLMHGTDVIEFVKGMKIRERVASIIRMVI